VMRRADVSSPLISKNLWGAFSMSSPVQAKYNVRARVQVR